MDLSRCAWYRGRGTCTFGCNDEPACQTMVPDENGWPAEVARLRPAIEALTTLIGDAKEADRIARALDREMLLADQRDPSRMVACDENCGAYFDPDTLEDAQQTIMHYQDHLVDGNCPVCAHKFEGDE